MNSEALKKLTLLYVEDEEDIREQLSRFLKRRVGTLYTAANGKEGIEAFRQHHPDLVITDIEMPLMNGLEMAEVIREADGDVPIIVATAFNELKYFMKSIEVGVDKYVMKPVNTDVLMKALIKCATIVSQRRALVERSIVMEADLDLAHDVQHYLLPKVLPDIPGINITASYHPIDKVGGDIYDVVDLGESYGILIADAMGHGVAAAFLTAMVKISFQLSIRGSNDPAKVLERMNRMLSDHIASDSFVTAYYAVYHPASRKLSFSSAGHPGAVLYKNSERSCISLKAKGFPLGVQSDYTYELHEATLEVGDKLFIFTDGIYEVEDSDGNQKGYDAFVGYIESVCCEMNAESIAENLLTKDNSGFIGNAKITDDITLVALELIGSA